MFEFFKLGASAVSQFHDFSILASLSRLGFSFVLTLFLAIAYKSLHSDKEDCHVIMHSIIYVGVIMSGAMMLIASNMVVAFGLIGAVSIVRFRTAVRSTIDMSFLFLSIVVGISCGLAFYIHATVLSIFLGILMFILNKVRFGMSPPSILNFEVAMCFKKKDFDPDSLDKLKEMLGDGTSMLEVRSSEKKVKVKFDYQLPNNNEVTVIYERIEQIFKHDPSLDITIRKK